MNAKQMIKNFLEVQNENEKWFDYLAEAEEVHQNLENVQSVNSLSPKVTLQYVYRTLELLEKTNVSEETKEIVEEVLKWSEVAKGGTKKRREEWFSRGYNLIAHNEGSARIYQYEKELEGQKWSFKAPYSWHKAVFSLIYTHGLIGQYIRGESHLLNNQSTIKILLGMFDKEKSKEILMTLNYCIIAAVSEDLWDRIKDEVELAIEKVLNFEFEEKFIERIYRLRSKGKETKDEIKNFLNNKKDSYDELRDFLKIKELWYVEPAIQDLSFVDFWTIFELSQNKLKDSKNILHINFQDLMQQMYYDYKGQKRVNIYRKRVIEKYLKDYRESKNVDSPHVDFCVEVDERINTAFISFDFSAVGEALINFCVEAEKVDIMHNRAVVTLFDLFNLRRDAYDRFHNEETYLETMNESDDKRKILDYLKGETILDIGPGGGIALDMIEEETEGKNIIGVDISENVIEALEKKKKDENRSWNVMKGNALNLSDTFGRNSVDTITLLSMLHEPFSYVEYNGKKFNHEIIQDILKSSFDVLTVGGRIIIRDGIMTEDFGQKRIIKFKDKKDIKFLEQYVKDFKGREVKYEKLSEDEVKMSINDSMEFLYTYTWGEESYAHEVNEQFGYFTPSEYKNFIYDILGVDHVKIVEFQHYLQEGYTYHLGKKVEFKDEDDNEVRLPDSTCFIVIEKIK